MDITCERNVQGTDITSERNVQWMDITSERNVQETNITSDGNVQGTDITCERKVQGTDFSCERNSQRTDRCWQDGDHTDGHYITLFSEQLTRTFEVLVQMDHIWGAAHRPRKSPGLTILEQ